MPVDVRTRFDQFPATIKGAFVLSGADGNPHAVDLLNSSIERIPTGDARPLALGRVRVDVAPGRDLFVPFEAGIGDLEPAWYAVRATIQVDGGKTWSFSSRGFSVPWAREAVRRGTIKVGKTVGTGRHQLVIEGVEMRTDCSVVVWRAIGEDPEPPEISLLANGRELEVLPPDARPLRSETGPIKHALFYPVPRAAGSLAIEVQTSARSATHKIGLSLA
jgi:hypothetical protein